jgi:hypothetical protein
MNLIGINETIRPSAAWPTDEELRQAINRTHELGGIAVLNHWAWSHVTGIPPSLNSSLLLFHPYMSNSLTVSFSNSFISLNFVEHCNNILEGGYDQWRIPGHPTRDELLSWGIDAFESVNGDTIDLATIYYSQKHSLPIYSGGDIHGPTGQPHAWTTLLLPEEER